VGQAVLTCPDGKTAPFRIFKQVGNPCGLAAMLKNRILAIVRVIFQRKKFILLPVIGIPFCFAIYAFLIAPETYRAENRIVALDYKTNRPIAGGLSMTSDLGKRMDAGVKRITSRSGITAIIASIDYLAEKFPASAEVQRKRKDTLAEKRGILDYRLKHANSLVADMNGELNKATDAAEKQRLAYALEDLLRDKRVCESQSAELQKEIAETDAHLRLIADGESEFHNLVERGKKEPGNEKIRLLVQARQQSRNKEQARLDEMVDNIRESLKAGVNSNGITASFESDDPQLCRDVVDETLLGLESENFTVNKQETGGADQIPDQNRLAGDESKPDEGIRFDKPGPTALPTAPFKPNRRTLMALGLLLGAAAAATLLFLVKYADRSIRGIADVKRRLGLPVLGTVPRFFKTDKGVKTRTGFNVRKAAAYIATTTAVALLVMSFVFDREAGGLIHQKSDKKAPLAEKNNMSLPAFLDRSGTGFTAEARPETKSFAADEQAQRPAPPDIEVADPDALSPEEKP